LTIIFGKEMDYGDNCDDDDYDDSNRNQGLRVESVTMWNT
jgi:hypothetical protein